MFTICSLYIHNIFTIYSLHMFIVWSLYVHFTIHYTLLTKINWPPGNKLIENQRTCTVTLCLKLYVHYMFTIYSFYVHYIFTVCSLYVHYMFTIYFTIYSLYIHYICSLYGHYMFTICSLYAHYMFTTHYTLLTKINWPSGNKLVENQRKCIVTSCLKVTW